ncbi:MAG: 50S ribosomal protein L11 methyltransferase [Candidatus Cohnella colombiensis]|uniref:Ribosomal protein L11 methyltransferase n=1 Tax=Candidatus Cohnella colombiensis TaxID=3121368 RepID=A0AA95EXG0_9BACL|nr:MAG: 50S ribosomal protein L11 methyltransferase [Cohnella sp.]
MRWHELTVLATESSQEMVTHYLTELGAAGVSVEEGWDEDKPRDTTFGELYDGPLNQIRKGYAEFKAYFSEETDLSLITSQLEELLRGLPEYGYDAGEFVISTGDVHEDDWAHAWKKYFKPVAVTPRLTIKPTWEEYSPREDEVIIEIDPGMAFGTGTHPTTTLCLVALDQAIRGGEQIIDVGTGSGILAIGAMKLGAEHVLAVDLDPVAVASAQDNIRLNGLEERVEVRTSDLLGVLNANDRAAANADIVVANILAEIIMLFLDDVMEVLKPGGLYICSGIYKNKEQLVESGLQAAGFELVETLKQEDWVAFVARKPEGDA